MVETRRGVARRQGAALGDCAGADRAKCGLGLASGGDFATILPWRMNAGVVDYHRFGLVRRRPR